MLTNSVFASVEFPDLCHGTRVEFAEAGFVELARSARAACTFMRQPGR